MKHKSAAIFFAAWLALVCGVAMASNANLWSPTTGTVSGLQLTNNFNAALDALNTKNSGAAAPSNQLSGGPSLFNEWCNTTAAPYPCNIWDGFQYDTEFWLDPTNHIPIMPIGGGTATIASAATTDLWSVPQTLITVSGTTTITALASGDAVPGQEKTVCFTGVLTLTYNATSLPLPNSAQNITTAAGDCMRVVAMTTSYVRVVSYTPASGASANSAGGRVLLNTLTASSSAYLQDATSLTSAYSVYEIEFTNVLPSSSSSPNLQMLLQSGGVFQTSSYVSDNYAKLGDDQETAYLPISNNNESISNVSPGLTGSLKIYNPAGTTMPKWVKGEFAYQTSAGGTAYVTLTGFWNGNGAITGIEAKFSAGNIASGTIKIFGTN